MCVYSIPAETSPDLRDLLMRLLKRNAKDRMDFGERVFFVGLIDVCFVPCLSVCCEQFNLVLCISRGVFLSPVFE